MWTLVLRVALAATLCSCVLGTTAGAEQAREGPSLLAEFRAWQKAQPNSDDWARLLDRYRTKLVGDGRSADAADRAIRIITAYDEAELYDSIYAKGSDFNTAPNQFLVDVTSTLSAGRALDVGMGMGRNALHLARKGWDVVGFDVSSVGVQHAQATAKAERLTLQAVVAADDEFDFGRARWDLVTIIYALEKRSVRKVSEALRPGGLVVVEAGINPDPNAAFGFAPGELRRIAGDLEILRYEESEGRYDWGPETIRLVRMVARKPR
jgi:SAM-dependent methyltransferase